LADEDQDEQENRHPLVHEYEHGHELVREAEASFVLSTLEHDQLVRAKKAPVPRRRLGRGALLLFWALRVYVMFMLVVVFWQAWIAVR
jgi:hypothetical protein